MELEEQMQPLKVGDKVYSKRYERWGNNTYYYFAVVERLTKTQAILSGGTRLINTPKVDYFSKIVCYPVYGDTWVKWSIQTPEILEEAKLERERQSVLRWFKDRQFSEEEKRIIYNTFKELNILNSDKEPTTEPKQTT
jgi:hypothetical protein